MDFIDDSLRNIKKTLQKATIIELAVGSNLTGKLQRKASHDMLKLEFESLLTDIDDVMRQGDLAVVCKTGEAEAAAVGQLKVQLGGIIGIGPKFLQAGQYPRLAYVPFAR